MDTTVLVSLIGLAGVLGGSAMGWFAKVMVASISAPPKAASQAWNGNERRIAEIVDAKVIFHAYNCTALKQFQESLRDLRTELRADMKAMFEDVKTDLHHLHQEIQRD